MSSLNSSTATIKIDSHFNQDGRVFGYFNGDFNYDGAINGDDYFIINSNWNTGSTAAPFPTGDGLTRVMAVPEPASIGMLTLAACGLAGLRRPPPAKLLTLSPFRCCILARLTGRGDGRQIS